MRKGAYILAHATTAEDKALGLLAYAGPPIAVTSAILATALATAGLVPGSIGAISASTATEAGVGLSAYQIAKEGGRHSGWLKNQASLPISRLERAIRSFDRGVQDHLNKIADPAKYARDWDGMSEQEREGLLKFWAKEAVRYQEQADILRGLVEEKTRGNP